MASRVFRGAPRGGVLVVVVVVAGLDDDPCIPGCILRRHPARRVVGVATASGPAVSGRRASAAGSVGVV